MLATQGSAREGRDDGAKMAAQLRVLPLRGQETKQKTKLDNAIFLNECFRFCFFARNFSYDLRGSSLESSTVLTLRPDRKTTLGF